MTSFAFSGHYRLYESDETWDSQSFWTDAAIARADAGIIAAMLRPGVDTLISGLAYNQDYNPTDPTTNGEQIIFAYPGLDVLPGREVTHEDKRARSIDYLLIMFIRPDAGAIFMVCGGDYEPYPNGEVVWVSNTNTLSDIYAGFGHYSSNGTCTWLRALALVPRADLDTEYQDQYSAALAYDTFTRSNGSIGTAESGQTWSVISSTASVSSNHLTFANSATGMAILNAGSVARIIEMTVTTPGSGQLRTGLVFRSNSAGTQYAVLGVYEVGWDLTINGSLIASDYAGPHLEYSTTHRVVVVDYGETMDFFLDDTLLRKGEPSTSLNTNTYCGIIRFSTDTSNGCTFDDFAVWPQTLTLPAALTTVPNPPVGTGSATITDAFTGTNGTALTTHDAAWVEINGEHYEIQSNKAKKTTDNDQGGWVVQDTGMDDHEVAVTITLPGLASVTDWQCGLVVRCDGTDDNFVYVRYIYQGNSPEIEMWEKVTGAGALFLNAVNLGTGNLTANSTHTLKMAVKGREIAVYHDGEVVLQGYTKLTTGTYAGFGADGTAEDRPTYDDFAVKAVA